MVFFRIGGDEFILLTDSKDEAVAQRMAEKVIAANGQTIEFGGQQIPVSLRHALTLLDTRVPDRAMMQELQWTLD